MKVNLEKIKKVSASKRTRGISIISFLLTCFSYFLHPLYSTLLSQHWNTYGGWTSYDYGKNGFPWSFSIGSSSFSAFYFILDLIFWFIVVKLLLTGINLIKDSQK